jgi:hypothetical protein
LIKNAKIAFVMVFCFWRELFPGPCGLWLNIFGANFQNAKKSTQQPNHTDDRRQSNKDDNIPNAHKHRLTSTQVDPHNLDRQTLPISKCRPCRNKMTDRQRPQRIKLAIRTMSKMLVSRLLGGQETKPH